MQGPDFDIAIVGGGSAGLELARMASRAGLRVAVIEQGASNGRHLFQRIPLMVGKIIGNGRYVDAWQSPPLAGAGGTPRPVLAGRGLGGSSRVNGNVAYAGPAARYASIFGPLGLDFTGVLAGLNGPVGRVFTWTDALSDVFLNAAQAQGARRVTDPDDDFFGASPLHVNTKGGWRYNHFDAYCKTAQMAQITVVRGTAQALDYGPHGVAGVRLTDGRVIAARETVLAAGAVGSPALLMRSGIGADDMIQAAGVNPMLNQPRVGQHLKDHANLRIPFSCPGHDTLNQKTRGLRALAQGLKFMAGHADTVLRGPGASVGLNAGSGHDPYRIQLVHFTQDRSQVGTKGIVFERQQGASLGLYALWPKSEGSVQLAADGSLCIDPGFLANDHDVATTTRALGHARGIIADMGFAPRPSPVDDETLIRSGVYSGYHLIGSNRMAATAADGVVGPDFAVHGVAGLSVCDASVMPDHLSSHSYLPTIAMARMFGQQRGWAW